MMNPANRRRANRLRLKVESLEVRALLAFAGTLDPSFGFEGAAGRDLGVPVLPDFAARADSVLTLPGTDEFLVTGTVSIDEPGSIVTPGITRSTNGVIIKLPTPASSAELVMTELSSQLTPNRSFGVNGQVQVPIAFGQSFEVALQPDGKILLASTTGYGYLVARFDANGSLDSSFGTDGVAEDPASSTTPEADRIGQLASVLVEPDGQILLAGASAGGFTTVRLNSDGSLDTTYGTDGSANVPVTLAENRQDEAAGAVLLTSGQVILAGNVGTLIGLPSNTNFASSDAVAIRLNPDGSLDKTFGGPAAEGVVVLPPDPGNYALGGNLADSIDLQPTTGEILVAGNDLLANASVGSVATLYRLNPDGILDARFGNGGRVEPSLKNNNSALGLAVQADGSILLTANVSNIFPGPYRTNLELLRLDLDGTPDPSFGNSSTPGVFLSTLNSSQTPGPAILATNGDILLAGISTNPANPGLTYGLTVLGILPEATTGPSAPPTPQPRPADLTGLGYSDLAVYNPTTGTFDYQSAIPTTNTDYVPAYNHFAFGIKGEGQTIPAVADYQGLGYDQFAAYLSASGIYAIEPDSTSPGLFLQFGMAGIGNSFPVPADYQGTGKADVAVYMPSIATFAILPSDGAPGYQVHFGMAGVGQSIPAPADYYGTGQDDIAVYLPSIGAFAIQDPSGKSSGKIIPFGPAGIGAIPAPGHYSSVGHVDLAVYVPSLGAYFDRPSTGGPDKEVLIGTPNPDSYPVPGDYDGSSLTEMAIYEPDTGDIIYKPADGGPDVIINLVSTTDSSKAIPVATPAEALPEFQINPGGPLRFDPLVSAAASTATPTAVVPSPASIRVALSPVNQASTGRPGEETT